MQSSKGWSVPATGRAWLQRGRCPLSRFAAGSLSVCAAWAGARADPQDGTVTPPVVKTWVGPALPTYGSFSTASNWSPVGAPTASEAAVFSAQSASSVRGVSLTANAQPGQIKFGSAGSFDNTVFMRLSGVTLQSANFAGNSLIIGGMSNGVGNGFTTLDLQPVTQPGSIVALSSLIGGARDGRLIVRDRVTASLGIANVSGGSVTAETGSKVASGTDVFVFGTIIRGGMSVAGAAGRSGTLNIKPGGALESRFSLSIGSAGNFQAGGVCNVLPTVDTGVGGSFFAGVGSTVATSAITVGAPTTSPGLAVATNFGMTPNGANITATSYTHVGGNLSLSQYNGVGLAITNLIGPAVISGGGLTIDTYAPGFSPSVGQSFTILQPTSLTGRFPVAVFPGFGDQRFLRAAYFPAASPPRIDLVVAAATNPYGFVPPQSVNLTQDPRAGRLLRFNADVFPDLALIVPGATPSDPGSLVILTNAGVSGAGAWLGFSSSVQIAIGRDPSALAVGDLNGDNLDDIVISERGENRIRVLRNSAGSYPPGLQSLYTTDAGPTDVTINFLDELPGSAGASRDIAVANNAAGTVQVFTNNGSGVYTNAATIALPSGGKPTSIDSGDVDNDKDIDLVVGAGSATAGASAGVIPNTATTDVVSFGPYVPTPVAGVPVSIVLSDLNGDGFPEALAACSGGFFTIMTNSLGSFVAPANLGVGTNALSVTAADADGDGLPDPAILVEADVGAGTERVVRAYRNTTTPTPGSVVTLSAAAVLGSGTQPSFVLAGDVDNDGVADLITGNRTLVGDGAGSDAPPKIDTRLAVIARPAPGDVNGDGAVNFLDLNLLLNAYGRSTNQPGYLPGADFNRDGVIDFIDLNTVLSRYGT